MSDETQDREPQTGVTHGAAERDNQPGDATEGATSGTTTGATGSAPGAVGASGPTSGADDPAEVREGPGHSGGDEPPARKLRPADADE